MNTSDHQWEKSTFVSASHVLHKKRNTHRASRRFSTILRAEQVVLKPEPVVIGVQQDKISITPIIEKGQIKGLRVMCACGCEATFDIQYQQEGVAV